MARKLQALLCGRTLVLEYVADPPLECSNDRQSQREGASHYARNAAGASEVQILEEPRRIVIVLDPTKDPIYELGKNPVTIDVTDASVNHDRYNYGD